MASDELQDADLDKRAQFQIERDLRLIGEPACRLSCLLIVAQSRHVGNRNSIFRSGIIVSSLS